MRIPKRLRNNPIIESVAEVRFESSFPPETIIGVVYARVKKKFEAPTALPIVQLPISLREKDPNLKYQATHRFARTGHVLLVGPRTMALSTNPYSQWSSTTPMLKELLADCEDIGLFSKVGRTGLRYVNFFEKLNIFEHLTLSLAVKEESIAGQSIVLRTEAEREGFKVITKIANTAEVSIDSQNRSGSLLDIDIVLDNPNINASTAADSLLSHFAAANALADKTFFSLLTEEFVKRYEPEY